MPRPQGHDRATCTDPTSDAKDKPTHPTVPPLLPNTPEGATDLFQCMVILTENLNILKKRVNSEKKSQCDVPPILIQYHQMRRPCQFPSLQRLLLLYPSAQINSPPPLLYPN